MKLFVFNLLFSACLASQSWPALRTTFGSFLPRPRTAAEAEAAGWQLLSSCSEAGPFLGARYGLAEDNSIILIYDAAGYIAGTQSVVPVEAVGEEVEVVQHPAYQLASWFSAPAYLTTMYFVDPSIICAGGRTQDQFDSQGTGDRLVVQVGPTADGDNLLELPLTKEAAEADPAWYDHLCFPGMGDHFMQFDHSPDQECGAVLPVQLLYDDGYEGSVAGFTWQHFFMIGTLPSTVWEHPDQLGIDAVIDSAPACVYEALETTGVTSMHHYFWEDPLLILCPE